MEQLKSVMLDPQKFKMDALPQFADFLLKNHLDNYVNVMLDYSRREKLPLLDKLSKFTDAELLELGKISHAEILQALASHSIDEQIRQNVGKWIANNLEVIDKDEVVAEDLTLSAYIKRSCMQSFIPTYTSDTELQQLLREEIDRYTTQEELISYSTYIRLQQEKLNRTNEALKFQESLLLEAQELSELGSFFIDYQNPENSMSTPQIEIITGMDGRGDEDFFNHVHPDDLAYIKQAWQHALENGGDFDYTFRYRQNGVEKRLHSRGIVNIANGAVQHVKGTLRDITKSAELIEKLTESESLNMEAQKLTHLGNWSWDIGSNSIKWSDEMFRIYGLEPQSETITFERFIGLIHPESRAARIEEINESLETGIVKDYTLKIVTPAGQTKVLRGYGSMAKDASGVPVKLVGTCQDITAEYLLNNKLLDLNRELSEKNVELLRSNKELESFNYIASHDLQEPLRKIELYSEKIIFQTPALPESVIISLQKVIKATARMRALIKDLMAFSQISLTTPVFETVSLDWVVDDAKDLFLESIEQGEAIFEIQPMPNVPIIPFQFKQLLTNMFGNAIKYKKPDQPVTIRVTHEVLGKKSVPFADAVGKYLKISIADDGIGFQPEQREKIFDLFKRLHSNEIYAGTGIGLAICKKIMEIHRGYLTADGTPGVGSVFEIYLPFN